MRESLLGPFQFKGICFRNPFAIASTGPEGNKGRVTPELLIWFRVQAHSDAALVVAGPASLLPPVGKFTCLRADQPKFQEGLRTLAKVLESAGAVPGLRLIDSCHSSHGTELLQRLNMGAKAVCLRLHALGFRYFEIDLPNCGLLSRIAGEWPVLWSGFFVELVDALAGQAILALRIADPGSTGAARAFLEAGGDLVVARESQLLAGLNRGQSMIEMAQGCSAHKVVEHLRQAIFVGLPEKKVSDH
jgi:hypothetical protein